MLVDYFVSGKSRSWLRCAWSTELQLTKFRTAALDVSLCCCHLLNPY